ncbi:MAG: LL-diaminopimelate aminotransferase, partial [Chlamydiae bacterium]|nr:LL-diaminopimelate aminotransferase [Chlamydiota bacterium]
MPLKGNPCFQELKREYVFPIVEKKLETLRTEQNKVDVLNLGVGDIALPLAPSIAQAISEASFEMSLSSTLRGYGPSQGYAFLREAIHAHAYASFSLSPDEVFISDGINTDIVNILDLFDPSCSIALPNPAYPAYLDACILGGRKENITFMPCTEETGFVPQCPTIPCHLIYLCSPHNPTGVAMTRERLAEFVSYAQQHQALLLYDNAYEAFITSKQKIPQSIYEIPGAEEVALEFRSFSKSCGFTGLRCSYLVLPKTVKVLLGNQKESLHPLWLKRQSIKFNGVSYPIQKGALACLSPRGLLETQRQVASYLEQTRRLKEGLQAHGQTCFGGLDAPYIWWKTPSSMSSWDFFDLL